MIAFVMIGTNDLLASTRFYDAVLNKLDMVNSFVGDRYVGYAEKNSPNKIELYVTKPFNKEIATNGNGTMIALLAKSRDQVDSCHKIALENGATNEGLPGQRPPNSNDYYAYFRDLSGNKICVHSK